MAARDVPWLDKRNGVYNVFWYEPPSAQALAANPDAKGRTKRLGLRTRNTDEAQARYAAFLVDRDARNIIGGGPSRSAGLTIARALDDYHAEHITARDDRGRHKVADPVRAENAIVHLKNWFGEAKLLRSIDIPACRGYAEARRKGLVGGGKRHPGDKKRGADSTIRRELVVLRAASNHALRWKRISLQDFPTFEMPRDADAEEAPWFTKEEFAAILKAQDDAIALAEIADGDVVLEQKFRDWIELTYWWGARKTSTARLQAGQVSLASGVVNLQKAGERTTKKRRPKVPIYDHIRPTLERRMAAAEQGWLFGPTIDFYRRFVALCGRCGLADKAWPHVLRHSRATHMLMDGENPYKVAKLLGDSLVTVLRVYGHHSVEFLNGEQS